MNEYVVGVSVSRIKHIRQPQTHTPDDARATAKSEESFQKFNDLEDTGGGDAGARTHSKIK